MFLSYVRVLRSARENIANYRWHISAPDGIVAEKPKAGRERERERETGCIFHLLFAAASLGSGFTTVRRTVKFSRDRCSRAISPTFPTTLVKRFLPNARGCRNIHQPSPPGSLSRCHASTAASLCKLYASDDLKRIQLFCAMEKPLLANLIVNRRVFINVRVRIEQR